MDRQKDAHAPHRWLNPGLAISMAVKSWSVSCRNKTGAQREAALKLERLWGEGLEGGGGSWWYFPCMQSDPKTQVQPPHSPLSTCPPPPPMLPSVCPSDPPLHLMTGDLPALKPLIFNDEGGWGRLMDPAMLPIIRQTLLDIRLFGNVLKVQELPIFWNKMQI